VIHETLADNLRCHAAGVVASQWLAVRLQSIAAAVVALVGLLSAAESTGLLPGPGHHAMRISASALILRRCAQSAQEQSGVAFERLCYTRFLHLCRSRRPVLNLFNPDYFAAFWATYGSYRNRAGKHPAGKAFCIIGASWLQQMGGCMIKLIVLSIDLNMRPHLCRSLWLSNGSWSSASCLKR
jgi:hypothetical protein